MGEIIFSEKGFEDYLYWQKEDKKILKKVNDLIKDVQRNSFSGLGKPEPLKGKEHYWSRRIDHVHRLVYSVADDCVKIVQCRGHYDD